MISTSDFRNGMIIRVDERLYSIVDFQHVKPGKGGAFVRTRLKDVLTGLVLNKTFRAGESFEEVKVEERRMQLLYKVGDDVAFMDLENYEQIEIDAEKVREAMRYMKENDLATVLFYKGEVLDVIPPTFVDLKVIESPPGLKGDTVSGGTKRVVVETDLELQVPLFVEKGDVIRIDTRTGRYVERKRSNGS